MKKRGRLLIALALVIVMALSLVLMACDDSGYKVTFDVDGGSAVEEMTDVKVIEQEPATMKSGHTFLGWFTNAERSGDRITFPYTVTADTTLYAKWQKDEEQVEDTKKFASAADVFGKTADLLFGALSGAVESINSKTLGYDINAVVGINDTKHHLDLSTAINVENVAVGALVNYEEIKGETSLNKVTVQVHDGNVYLTSGEKAYVMPFLGLDGLLAAVVGKEGIDFTAISSAWEGLSSYLPLVGGVLFNNDFTYDKDANSATITVTNTELAGKIDTILSLLGGFDLGEGRTIQQLIDETVWNMGLPYEINLQEIVSAFNFQLDITLDMTAEDAFEKISVALTLDKSEIVLKQLASCPTYVDGVRQPLVYEVDADNNVLTNKIDIPATAVSLDLAINARTTAIDAPAEDVEFVATNLINVDSTGKIFFKDSKGGTATQEATMLLKADLDITKLMKIVDGKIVANTEEFANAGYFRFNITSMAAGVGTLMEIVFDPAHSLNNQAYAYIRLGPNTTDNPTTIRLTFDLDDLVDYINSNATQAQVAALADGNGADTVVNGLIGIIGKLAGDLVITNGLTLGQITSGINYSYNDGLSVNVAFLDILFEKLGIQGVVSSKLFVGDGRDTIQVKVETFNWFGAEKGYNAFDECKALEFTTAATLNGITLDYNDSLDMYLAGQNNNLTGTITNTTGTSNNGNFTVVKTVGYDPTKVGEQVVEVYGYSAHPNDAFLVGIVAGFVDIPFGMIKTTLKVTVGEKIEPTTLEFDINDGAPVWLRYNSEGELTVTKGNIVTQLAPKLVGATGTINIANSYCQFVDKDGNIVPEIKEAGVYKLRATKLGEVWELPFNVYSTNLPMTSFANNSITIGESIESLIRNYYYSYPTADGVKKITFTLEDVILSKTASGSDILVDGAIPEGTDISNGHLVFSFDIDSEPYEFKVASGLIKQKPGYVEVTERFTTLTESATTQWLVGGLALYGADSTRKNMAISFNGVTKKVELLDNNGAVYADNVTLKFFNAAEEEITTSVYNADTGVFTVTEDIANTTVTMKATFTTLNTKDQGEWKNITSSFEAEIMCAAMLTGIPEMIINSVKEGSKLDGVLKLVKASAEGNPQEYVTKLEDDKKYYFKFGSFKGEEVEFKFFNADEDVTAAAMTNGVMNNVDADTTYTLVAEINGVEVFRGDFTVTNVIEATLTGPKKISPADGEAICIPLTYSDTKGVAHNLFLVFKAELQVDFDWNSSYSDIEPKYGKNVFYLAEDDKGEKPFTDGRAMSAGSLYKPVVVSSIVMEPLMPSYEAFNGFSLDPTTGKFAIDSNIEMNLGGLLKITVTIYGVEHNLSIQVGLA